MSKINNEMAKIKHLMNYSHEKDNNTPYRSIEYIKEGVDGKTYGIIKEGSSYYIKVTDKKGKNLVSENFEYIGGFMEKAKNQYNSFTKALKNLDLKLMNLKESYESKSTIIESTNPEVKEVMISEATDSMRDEIKRQRQIMLNAQLISENYMVKPEGIGFGKVGDSEPFAKNKAEINQYKGKIGTEKEANEEPFNEKGEPKEKGDKDCELKEVPGTLKGKAPMKPVMEAEEYEVEDVELSEPEDEEVIDIEGENEDADVLADELTDETAACDGECQDTLSMILQRLGDLEAKIDEMKYSNNELYPEDETSMEGEGESEFELEIGDEMPMEDEEGEMPMEDEEDEFEFDDEEDLSESVKNIALRTLNEMFGYDDFDDPYGDSALDRFLNDPKNQINYKEVGRYKPSIKDEEEFDELEASEDDVIELDGDDYNPFRDNLDDGIDDFDAMDEDITEDEI